MKPGLDDKQYEQLIEEITREIFNYLGDQQLAELRGLEIDELVCPGCDHRCVETCAIKARRVLEAGADRLSAGPGVSEIPADVASMIDHTLLKPEAACDDIIKMCEEAVQFGFASVVVNPYWVPTVVAAVRGTPVKVCTVVGFPLGATLPVVKVQEAEEVVKLGAQEVDMVANVGALKSGDDETVEQDIRGVANVCWKGGALLKVILETALLTDEEVLRASCLAQRAGADFVKTSTGFGPGGATTRHVELMRLAVGPAMGVKAAGGIRSYEDVQKMVSAGATRIGASASVKIMKEAAGSPPEPVPAGAGAPRY
jgi:deoxyribose-phosphate aldolase